MKMRFLGVLLGSLFCAAVPISRSGAAPNPRWHTDYEQAKALAGREGKPLFVVFR